MTSLRSFPAILLVAAILWGCGESEEITQEVPSQPPAPVTVQVEKKPEFETRTDTVATVHMKEQQQRSGAHREPQIRFMVQIGAFKDPKNASEIQTSARQRYHLPVLNDYHTKLGLYQIRIGFFETREAAQAFRLRMQQEFSNDYKDCWVVQLKR